MTQRDPAPVSALSQYFLHSKLCGHWGYQRLETKCRELSMAEMRDAEAHTDRIVQLNAVPDYAQARSMKVGSTPVEQLTLAQDAETAALDALRAGIVTCEASGGMVAAAMFRGGRAGRG